MPHAVDVQDLQSEQDDELINSLLSGAPTDNALSFFERDLEPGEKAQDAEDYEDIGDDDLAEDEDELASQNGLNGHLDGDVDRDLSGGTFSDVPGDQYEDDQTLDDLFGDQPSSPAAEAERVDGDPGVNQIQLSLPSSFTRITLPGSAPKPRPRDIARPRHDPEVSPEPTFRDIEYGTIPEDDPELREQQELFAQAQREREERIRRGGIATDLPPAPQTNAELFETIWHNFDPNDVPRFGVLLPGKRAFYLSKTPLKPPRPVQPTKVNLDLQQDQERTFRLPGAATSNRNARLEDALQKGLVLTTDTDPAQQVTDDEIELDTLDDNEQVGGINVHDLALLCEDWDSHTLETMSQQEPQASDAEDNFMVEDDWDHGRDAPPVKKRKTGHQDTNGVIPVYRDVFPSLDDPELTTSKLSRRISLDLNDPQLLIDIQQPSTEPKKQRRVGGDFRRDVNGGMQKAMLRRYNISNDEAYDLLKENHQHKVRSTLGNLTVEHSLPALRLQYPFYKVKLSAREARSFHRPAMAFLPNSNVRFSKPRSVKRKHLKGLDTQTIFNKSHDLTLGDNSNMLLLEYSEEYPIMMSNFGMGNRLINYYRRKDMEDNARPKLDIGETAVLLPEDKSPFSIFGNIDPGQSMPTLQNGMYRAPVFKHETKPTDFLVVRTTTGVHGSSWYMRNIENLYVVGQEFPSQEVPGTHSRRVTEAAKKRLKMISYRIYKKNTQPSVRGPVLSNEMIRQHLPGTDIAQNRGKMREFMAYDKENQSWVPKKGDVIPDALTMRSWIKPEEVCLLDSMQVGHRFLQDAGYSKDQDEVDGEEDEEKDGDSIEEQLAPWQTTKNFLNACQGKAMLQLHGAGDPTGRGEGFSFIKTSMKGGFRPVGESVQDKLDAKRLKENGGHSYNVAKQQKSYEEWIKKIWDAQYLSLSSTIEPSEAEMDVDEEPGSSFNRGRSEFGTPAASARRDDETASLSSRFSANDKGKVLQITRIERNKYGKIEQVDEIIKDPKVIRAYLKRRRDQDVNGLKLTEMAPTGDADMDSRKVKALQLELARLERNKERRHVREKAKGMANGTGSSPATPGSPSASANLKAAGTQRKCANCGQVGHIKTNKKLCPMLNGKVKPDDGFDDSAFGTPVLPASAAQANPPSTFST